MATIDCPNCGIASRSDWDTCPDCGTALRAAPQATVETPPEGFPIRGAALEAAGGAGAGDTLADQRRKVIVTTLSAVEGHEVIEHIGPVSAVSILPIQSLGEWATNARAWFEEGPKDHVRKFEQAQDDVEAKLQHMAVRRGGNAVIGTSIDIQFVETAVGQSAARKLVISAAGTAVRVLRV